MASRTHAGGRVAINTMQTERRAGKRCIGDMGGYNYQQRCEGRSTEKVTSE